MPKKTLLKRFLFIKKLMGFIQISLSDLCLRFDLMDHLSFEVKMKIAGITILLKDFGQVFRKKDVVLISPVTRLRRKGAHLI